MCHRLLAFFYASNEISERFPIYIFQHLRQFAHWLCFTCFRWRYVSDCRRFTYDRGFLPQILSRKKCFQGPRGCHSLSTFIIWVLLVACVKEQDTPLWEIEMFFRQPFSLNISSDSLPTWMVRKIYPRLSCFLKRFARMQLIHCNPLKFNRRLHNKRPIFYNNIKQILFS